MKKRDVLLYSLSGNMPPRGDLSDAEAALAFPFGYRADSEGHYKEPGATNLALAGFILANPQLRQLDIVLSEELADALDGRARGKTILLGNFEQGQAGTTYDYAEKARKLTEVRDVGKLAVVAFRFHLPRANAGTERVGFSTVVPDLRQVGDFDPKSAQWWTRNRGLWTAREAAAVPVSIIKNQV